MAFAHLDDPWTRDLSCQRATSPMALSNVHLDELRRATILQLDVIDGVDKYKYRKTASENLSGPGTSRISGEHADTASSVTATTENPSNEISSSLSSFDDGIQVSSELNSEDPESQRSVTTGSSVQFLLHAVHPRHTQALTITPRKPAYQRFFKAVYLNAGDLVEIAVDLFHQRPRRFTLKNTIAVGGVSAFFFLAVFKH